MPSGISTNREFRHIFRKICGDTKSLVDVNTAYKVLSCCGKTVVQSHLLTEWPLNTQKIGVDRLFDIFIRLGDLCIEDHELEKMRDRKITPKEILDSIAENSMFSKLAVEQVIKQFIEPDGFVNIEKIVQVTQTTRDEVVERLMIGSNPSVSEHVVEPSTFGTMHAQAEKRSLIGVERKYVTELRGCLAINPKLQSISYRVDVLNGQTTNCEIVLSMASNSDVPVDHFGNDLFLIARNGEYFGISAFLANHGYYSTGPINIESNTELLVVAMGTSISRRKSTRERVILVEGDGKLSKRFKITLMNIFESFDVDRDGVLNRDELDHYTLASGDESLTDEEWKLYTDNFEFRDDGITLEGFLKMHQVEASDTSEHVISDLWHSLNCLGYDSALQLIYGCSYDVTIHHDDAIKVTSNLHLMKRADRSFILEKLYELGNVYNDKYGLNPHLYEADYFGLMVAKKDGRALKVKLSIENASNVRWNIPHSKNDDTIHISDSDSEYVLLATYTITDDQYSLDFNFGGVVQ